MNAGNSFLLFFFIASVLICPTANAMQDFSPEELEKWFNSDTELPAKK